MKNKIVVVSNYDVEVESEIKSELELGMKELVEKCSKKYMRNIKTSISIEVK